MLIFVAKDKLTELFGNHREKVNEWIVGLIENQRENVVRGWPELGVQRLDPLFVEKFEFTFDG